MKKQIYGEHYNYEYRKPRQNVPINLTYRKCTESKKTETHKFKELIECFWKKSKIYSNDLLVGGWQILNLK